MKENLDRERKNLTKKKAFLQQQQMIMATTTDETITQNSNFNSQASNNLVCVPLTKLKRTTKTSTIKPFTK